MVGDFCPDRSGLGRSNGVSRVDGHAEKGECELRIIASEFEIRHAKLIRRVIVLAAWATYLVDREDVVWRFTRRYPNRFLLEHSAFGFATLFIGTAAVLSTRTGAAQAASERGTLTGPIEGKNPFPREQLLGELLYAIGLASLVPLLGSVLLVVGECVRVLRLGLFRKATKASHRPPIQPGQLGKAIGPQTVKWGIFLTMIVFAVTLIDRVADYGILASILLGAVLNLPRSRSRSDANSRSI